MYLINGFTIGASLNGLTLPSDFEKNVIYMK